MGANREIELVLLSQRTERRVKGDIIYRTYACPCGRGTIEEEQDYTEGHRDGFACLKCSLCDKKYYIDFGQSATKWSIVKKTAPAITIFEPPKRLNGRDRNMRLFRIHAYEWIHTLKPEEIFNMKFDVIISNPPYQLNDGGNGVSAAPIFQLFVERAMKLRPRYLSMIIPARWYAGGKGLDIFREMMLGDRHIRNIVDYESSKDCFTGVNIAGGICYFLWDRDYDGLCEITNNIQDERIVSTRALNEFPILIRSNLAVSIVQKILNKNSDAYSDHAYPRNPFGFATNYRGRSDKRLGDIELLTSKGFQYVQRSEVVKNADIIDSYKVLIGRLVPSNGELDVDPKNGYRVITDTRIIGPGQINTETYLDIGVFRTQAEANNFDKFLKSKLPRFLLRQAISSLNVTRECFRFVPFEDFTQAWDDDKLYKKYGLTYEEIQLVETTIRPMDLSGGGTDAD